MIVQIEPSWKALLQNEFSKPYFIQIVHHIKTEKETGKTIFPAGSLIFNAFNKTPFNKVKVVILGQDPYHNTGQAMGLSFSVPKGITIPPSLVNVYKELKADIGMQIPTNGNLTNWAEQGVLLLNATLTVRENEANSHSKIGWMQFTDAVINAISEQLPHVVFILWGNFAQQKQVLINPNKHLILTAAHPSPLSAHNGFWGCKHFSKANQWLVSKGIEPVNWHVGD